MKLPQPGDYIDIHTHWGKPSAGIFFIESLMAHEEGNPGDCPQQACTYGIHPWYLNLNNYDKLINRVNAVTAFPNLIAFGEAGFDKIRGPSMDLQRRAFETQIAISEENKKPVVIHCVRAWDEMFTSYKKFRPKMPWLIHGFRGNAEFAKQLLSKGIYISFWFDFIIRNESTQLIRDLPTDRIFLETDGADVDISEIYKKVASDISLSVSELKSIILTNFNQFFGFSSFLTMG
jgi:TatD DNase family protein